MPKDTREPQEILAHVISSRVALTSAIFGLSEAQLTTPGPVGRWSVKDVMAHIGHWEEVCLEELQIHLRGERSGKDYRDAVALNDQWEAGLQALSLQESITLFEQAHYQLFALLAAVILYLLPLLRRRVFPARLAAAAILAMLPAVGLTLLQNKQGTGRRAECSPPRRQGATASARRSAGTRKAARGPARCG